MTVLVEHLSIQNTEPSALFRTRQAFETDA